MKLRDYCTFICEILKYSCVTVVDIIPQSLGMICLNLAKQEKHSGTLGFLISSFYVFACLFFNHSEVINLKSGVHFGQGDYRKLNKNILQFAGINLAMYLLSLPSVLLMRPFLGLLNVEKDFEDTVLIYLPLYCFGTGFFLMLANILRGKSSFCLFG